MMAYLDAIRVFVRVVDLGSITAGGRDLRLSAAVASNRIKALEDKLGIRLFNRTTRRLTPTEAGREYYKYAQRILEALDDAEGMVAGYSSKPRGDIRVTAPLGVGRRIVAPLVPAFHAQYPDISIRLRLSDRKVDIFDEGVDVAFVLGTLQDSDMKARKIMDCKRVLCAAPSYLAAHGTPMKPEDLVSDKHRCLLLRFPGSPEFTWMLEGGDGPQKYAISGPYDADDGDVLTDWALAGQGIVNKPTFEVARHLASGALVQVLASTPPTPARFACLYPHRRLQDPKVRLFVDFMLTQCRARVQEMLV